MNHETFSAIVGSMGVGVVAMDEGGALLACNAAAEQLLGVSAPCAPPAAWIETYGFFLPDEVTEFPRALCPLGRALRGETTNEVEIFVKNERIAAAHVSISARPIRSGNGAILGVVIVCRDISEQKHGEEERTKVTAFLNSIIENIPAVVFVKDAVDLRFELVNRAAQELVGLPRETILGKSVLELFPKEQAEFFQARDREALNSGGLVETPEEPIRTELGDRWLNTKKIPILDESGMPRYLLGISLDITAQKRAEQALQRANEDLEARVAERTADLRRANHILWQEIVERKRAEEALRLSEERLRQAHKMEAIGRLAGGVAHDFNNMLAVILSYTGLLASQLPPEGRMHNQVREIHKAGTRAATLTRQLLAFSRKQVLQRDVVCLSTLVSEMLPMLRPLIGESVELRTVLPQAIAGVNIDRGQMEQVIVNLVVNARDAMPERGTLTLETREVEQGGALFITLAVTDTGTGMDADTCARVFEPFFTTKEQGRGTGLGLAMAYGIVKQTGGDIVVTSDCGQGSTFTIVIPASTHDVATSQPSRSLPMRGGHETILLVEDEELVRSAVRSVLLDAGYTVLEASTADVGLEVFEQRAQEIDLVVTDIIMPSMSGLDLATRVEEIYPGKKVLFISGYADDAASHFDDSAMFLAKPFAPETLARKVREVLDTNEPDSVTGPPTISRSRKNALAE